MAAWIERGTGMNGIFVQSDYGLNEIQWDAQEIGIPLFTAWLWFIVQFHLH